MVYTLLLIALTSAQAKTLISSKCMAPLQEMLAKVENDQNVRIASPVECQYYQLKDLDEPTQAQINRLLRRNLQSSLPGDTKLTATMTALAQPRPCEVIESRAKVKMVSLLEQTENKAECLAKLTEWSKTYKNPSHCSDFLSNAMAMGKSKCAVQTKE